MKEIITYGSYAPSSHNAQMWIVEMPENEKIKVYPNYDRTLPFVDPNNRETWISIGAFIENCVLSAQDLGYSSIVTINDDEITLDFQQDHNLIKTKRNIELIKKRLTIRKPYLEKKIDDATITKLTNISDSILYFPSESKETKKIIDCSLDAYSFQMKDTDKLRELAKWMTFSYKEEKQRKDGITPEAIEIKGIKRFLFNLFISKKSVTGKAFIKSSIKSAKEQLNSCSGYILITSDSYSKIELIQAGRLLEQVWLECIHNEIAVHPMSQVLEEKEYYDLLKTSLKIDREIQMLLRIGKVKEYSERRRKRLDIKDIIRE
ncbi:hypothetical protein ATE84_0274 [Aquimarina sp. MAR_2010_214]|uniref:Acg family FMN-binding oxidoreductase n=1 Tax=Aquimarina sp. MAR_2010_214 TaxID=1250026 RepID=UPI000C7075F8|nr:hypothetical protein [Aquimarina sp. MAR_2010_214]PKV48278.1 hypothetical protein ATE84_0274 [Aquimarina sp. MAR_2010_214]